MIHLHTVYEFGKFTEALRYFMISGIFLLLGIVGWVVYYYNSRHVSEDTEYNLDGFSRRERAMRAGLLGMSAVTIIFPFIILTMISNYIDVRRRYNTHNYKIIQGRVTSLRDTTTRGGHILERFTVDKVRLETGWESLCYNKTRRNGGTIRNGLYVKITYYTDGGDTNCILKLETE